MLDSTRKINRKYFVVAAVLFCLTATLFVFETPILNFFWRLKYPTPVVWQNLRIHLDKGMVYQKDSETIYLTYWNNNPHGNLSITKLKTRNFSKLDEILSKEGAKIINAYHGKLKDFNSYYVKYEKAGEQGIKIAIYVKCLKLLLHYEGPNENYPFFRKVIDKMEFILNQKVP